MKKNIISIGFMAMMSLCIPSYVSAQDDTHGADFTDEDWGGDENVNFDFDSEGQMSGVNELSKGSSAMRISTERGRIVVWSSQNCLLLVFNLRGEVAMTARIQEGRNVVEVPAQGIYILNGKKVML